MNPAPPVTKIMFASLAACSTVRPFLKCLTPAALFAPLHAFEGPLPGVVGAFDRFKPINLNIRLAGKAQ